MLNPYFAIYIISFDARKVVVPPDTRFPPVESSPDSWLPVRWRLGLKIPTLESCPESPHFLRSSLPFPAADPGLLGAAELV